MSTDTLPEVTIKRTFNAPRAVVFKAWTDPKQLGQWFGPKGFDNPVCEADARPGGKLKIHMRGPDGAIYPCLGTFHEVVEPERLVFTWADPGDPQDAAPVVTVTLEDLGERTRMTFHVDGLGGQPGDDGVYDGWDSAFDVLTQHLA